MHYQEILSSIAGLIYILAFLPYIVAILWKGAQPSKATWLIWATLDTISLAGMYAKHAANGQIVAAVIGASTVAILSLKYGSSGWTWLDKVCLTGVILSLALWTIFSSPVLGIVTSLTAILIGGIPTFADAWNHPEHEDKLAWTIYWVSCIFAMAAIPAFTLADAAQPTVFFAIESIMVIILYTRPRLLARTAQS